MADSVRTPILCDLDGVIWLDHEPIPGSADAIARMRAAGHRVLFVTNNSASLVGEQEAALAAVGIPAVGEVVTSSQAAATLVHTGERVLVAGGPGVAEAIGDRGAIPVEVGSGPGAISSEGIDAAIVGLRRDVDYRWLTVVSNAVRDGARFIATNDDPTYPTPRGPEPGGGTIVAAVATASGVTPTIAGKPNAPMIDVIAARLGRRRGELGDAVMIGDRWSTDGAFAAALGARFGLVRSGATRSNPGAAVPQGMDPPTYDAPDLAALVDLMLS